MTRSGARGTARPHAPTDIAHRSTEDVVDDVHDLIERQPAMVRTVTSQLADA